MKPFTSTKSEMSPSISKVAVVGAGVMGAQIAAHFANAGIPSLLLDIVPGLARDAIARLNDLKPPPLFLPELSEMITPGNLEDDLGKLMEVDWVIEAVVENLDVKRALLKKISTAVKPNAILSSNTSGIRIAAIAHGFPDDFRRRFLGTHFFNPPRYLRLLEIIPTEDTNPEIASQIQEFCTEALGKGVILCKDTPNFIANRIGTFAVSFILNLVAEKKYTLEEVELLTGPLIGKPKSATLRTLDLVGIDTFLHVADNLYAALPEDEMRSVFKLPEFVRKMVEMKRLGEKSGEGFTKRVKNEQGETEILVLDLDTFEYRPRQKAVIPSAQMAAGMESLTERLMMLLAARDKGGDFTRKTTAATLAYAANRIPEITDSPADVDRAMKWGFGWQAGPFELWRMIGLERGAGLIESEGFKSKPYPAHEETSDPKIVNLARTKQQPHTVIAENSGASLIDLGDRVLCLEFHSKMNSLGDDSLKMANRGLDELDRNYDALVIGNQGENFSVGANLMLILMLAEEEEWDELEAANRRFQDLNMRIKYASKPVVIAPHGRTLGGGCELVLHAAIVCASAESYLGLVETGAGVIPAGGGTKEMAARAQERGRQSKPQSALLEAFQTIAFAKVSTSGYEARKIGFLRDTATFVMNQDHLLFEAKKIAHSKIAGYKPPQPVRLTAAGKPFFDSVCALIDGMASAGKISEHDALIGKKLAHVMSGGDVSGEVNEQHFLNLEREAFLSLASEKKTQERMKHLLKTGKPLRN